MGARTDGAPFYLSSLFFFPFLLRCRLKGLGGSTCWRGGGGLRPFLLSLLVLGRLHVTWGLDLGRMRRRAITQLARRLGVVIQAETRDCRWGEPGTVIRTDNMAQGLTTSTTSQRRGATAGAPSGYRLGHVAPAVCLSRAASSWARESRLDSDGLRAFGLVGARAGWSD